MIYFEAQIVPNLISTSPYKRAPVFFEHTCDSLSINHFLVQEVHVHCLLMGCVRLPLVTLDVPSLYYPFISFCCLWTLWKHTPP